MQALPGQHLFRNDGAGTFTDDPRALPQYTNNYEFEAMDLDGDGLLDLVTINDGDIASDDQVSRREHVFRNDGKGRFLDATAAGGRRRRTSAKTTTWWRSSTSTATATPISSSAR